MIVTPLNGLQVLMDHQREGKISSFPILVFLLAPKIEKSELESLVRRARWIDRSTEGIILFVLFWKSIRKTDNPADLKDKLTMRLIEDAYKEADYKALWRGFVDEASPIATALNIPIRQLPCIVVIDDPKSLRFYWLPYRGVDALDNILTGLVAFVKGKYPQYAKMRNELAEIESKIAYAHRSDRRVPRKIIRAGSQSTPIQKELDHLRSVLQEDDNQDNGSGLPKWIEQLVANPNDLTLTGQETDTGRRLRSLILSEAERTYYGYLVGDLERQSVQLRKKIRRLERPNIRAWINNQKVANSALKFKEKLITFDESTGAAESVIKRILQVAGLLLPFF